MQSAWWDSRVRLSGLRRRGSFLFADDEIAEAVDQGHLTLENERGGVELGDDGRALDAGAGAQSGAGVDACLRRSAFEEKPVRATARVVERGGRRPFRELRCWKDAHGVDPKGDELDRGVLLREGIKAFVQAVEGRHRGGGRGLADLLPLPGHVKLEALVLIAHAGKPAKAPRGGWHLLLIEPGARLSVQGAKDAGDFGDIEGAGLLQRGAGELGF